MSLSIQLDGEWVAAAVGETVLQVARRAGRTIPSLCHVDGLDTPDSCLLCVVEVRGQLLPSCSLKVQPNLVVVTHGPRVQHARQVAMQLLLSEHQGECRAPCELACPAGWDIAEFEQTLPTQPKEAARMALDGLGLPTTLGQVCDAPCHRACRRGELDRYLDIRRTHAHLPLGDLELPAPPQGPAVIVVGGGPTGLAAAHRLVQLGYLPTILERGPRLGGSLLPLLSDDTPLQADLQILRKLGVQWHTLAPVERADLEAWLGSRFAAAVVAAGPQNPANWPADPRVVLVSNAGLHGTPIRRVALGRAAAEQVDRALRQVQPGVSPIRLRYQDLAAGERAQLLRPEATAPLPDRDLPDRDLPVEQEAALCLGCGCLQHRDCHLNVVAAQLRVPPARIAGQRRPLQRDASHRLVVLEAHKCVLCQACVAVADGELAMTGRGFATRPAAAFGLPLAEALSDAAALRAAAVCPTRAFALQPGVPRGDHEP